MESKSKITKQLYWYARYLVLVFAFTMILSAGLVVWVGGETCYREPTQEELLYNDTFGMLLSVNNSSSDCMIVQDLDVIENRYNRYKIISIICIIGYLVFLPRDNYRELKEKIRVLIGEN